MNRRQLLALSAVDQAVAIKAAIDVFEGGGSAAELADAGETLAIGGWVPETIVGWDFHGRLAPCPGGAAADRPDPRNP